MPRVWRPVWIMIYPFSHSLLADCRHQCAKLGCMWMCPWQHRAAPRRDDPPLALRAFVLTCLLSVKEIIPPVLNVVHPPNHVWCCRPVLANCSLSPSLVTLWGHQRACWLAPSLLLFQEWLSKSPLTWSTYTCLLVVRGHLVRDWECFSETHPFWKSISIYQRLTWIRGCFQARMSPLFNKILTSLCKPSCCAISHNVTLVQQNTERELLRPALVCGISLLYSMIIFSHFLCTDPIVNV